MRKFCIAGIAALAIAGSTAVYAQHRHWFHGHMRMSPEDRAAFADARIAAVHAGLKLNAGSGKAVAAGRGRGAGFRQTADRSRQCADECASRTIRTRRSRTIR